MSNRDSFEQHKDVGAVAAIALVTGNINSAIERQEKQGQEALVAASDRLPKTFQMFGKFRGWGWDQIGPIWGVNILGEADDIFLRVELAPGWSIQPTDHSMWTRLVDDRGRERAAIFYKAAFYDRSAHIHPLNRYFFDHDYDSDDSKVFVIVRDKSAHSALHVVGDCERDDWRAMNALDQAARVWLDEHYPDHLNPLAYW